LIELPTSRGIEKFKKRIKPFVDLVAMSMVGKWGVDDCEKVAIRRMTDKPVPYRSLKETYAKALKKSERYYYNIFDKLTVPQHFRKNKEYHFDNEKGPPVRIFFDKKARTRYIDIGNTRLTISNWKELEEEIVPTVSNYLRTVGMWK
jgi:hypothetical protein